MLGEEEGDSASPTVTDSNVRPALNVENATDPFADDPEPAAAPPAEAAKPAEKSADDPFAEDPFK
jgi:hypothetical protein